jgi:2-methylcitrate dehydratase PrpD
VSNASPTNAAYPTLVLSRFVADLSIDRIPAEVIARAQELFIDWLGSALAGRGAPAVKGFEALADRMGPASGPCTVLVSRKKTSAYFAALINGASSHVAEQDDVHNGSVFHPGAVVFPAILAAAEAENSSGRKVMEAIIAGYEVGIRVGEALGRSHYEVFHTTGTAGTLAAAAAVAKLYDLPEAAVNHALGTAGTQAAGLWEFRADAADSKQVHTAKAAADGMMAAFLAREGVTGAKRIVEGPRGMAAGMSRDADVTRLDADLGKRWALVETSLKWHSSCRHTHPAADALEQVMAREKLAATDIAAITAHVHQGAIDVLGPVQHPTTIHQAKFCMGSVLGLIAVCGKAGLAEFDGHALTDKAVLSFLDRVEMRLDPEVNAAYPRRWIGKVTVTTKDGRQLSGRVDEAKGDPGNPLTPAEVKDKAIRLAAYRGAATRAEMEHWLGRIERLPTHNGFSDFIQ